MRSLPHCKKPCKDCPFRKDTLKGWLGADRMRSILNQSSFTCHETDKALQCAGHMIIKGQDNGFVNLATRFGLTLDLTGKELIFDSEEYCIEHHKKIIYVNE